MIKGLEGNDTIISSRWEHFYFANCVKGYLHKRYLHWEGNHSSGADLAHSSRPQYLAQSLRIWAAKVCTTKCVSIAMFAKLYRNKISATLILICFHRMTLPNSFLTFGLGIRSCIGMQFADRVAKVVLTSIISRYKLQFCVQTPHSLQLRSPTVVITPTTPIYLQMSRL